MEHFGILIRPQQRWLGQLLLAAFTSVPLFTVHANGTTNGIHRIVRSATSFEGDPPNAGTDGTLAVCSNGSPADLFAALQGNPDAGGTWSGPSPTTGQYNPATMQPGSYIYTVSGEGIFPDASATVVVDEQIAPNAGTDGAVEVCHNSSGFTLINILGGNPNIGGLWRYSTVPITGLFLPSADPEGVYTYIAPGFGACANDSSEVLVTVIDLALGGIDGPDEVPEVGTLTFTATPLLNDADTYTWDIPLGWTWDDTDPNDGTAHLVPPEEAGVYSICATASGGECVGNEVCFETEVTVGIAPARGAGSFELVVYPNPNNGSFTVLANGTQETLHLQIMNALGEQVAAFVMNYPAQVIDLDQFAAGTYTMRWIGSERRGSQRIVVVH